MERCVGRGGAGSPARVCCAIVSWALCGSVSGGTEGEGAWASGVARRLAEASPGSAAMVAIVEPVPGLDASDTRLLGLAGSLGEGAASRLRREAEEGFPADDLGRRAGHYTRGASVECATAEDLGEVAAWESSALAGLRREAGLGGLARSVASFEECGEARVMIVQIDAVGGEGEVTARDCEIVSALAVPLADAYRHRFVALREHRAGVLARLSEAQERVFRHLVEGHSETEVGRLIRRSSHTVHDHTKTIYQALGVRNRLQLRDLWFGRELAGGGNGGGEGEG